MKKSPKNSPEEAEKVDLEQQVQDLTLDLQRTRADFENYRKRVEVEKQAAKESGRNSAILSLLPVIDTIERAVVHIPKDIVDHQWVVGVAGLIKQLDKVLSDLNVKRIPADPGVEFDPSLHQAVQFDEDADGDKEVIAEELQAGYTLNDQPIRHAMVKVTRQ